MRLTTCLSILVLMAISVTFAEDNISCRVTSLQKGPYFSDSPVLEKYQAVLLLVVGIGGLSLVLATIHNSIRRYIYHDGDNLDTVFDAGGNVSFGLTSVTVMSQMLWPADFIQSSTLMSKTGLGGSLFYSFGVVMAIVMFPLLSIRLKTIAPGAKTYLQIIYARYGKRAHILYCCIALFVNLIIILALVLASKIAIGTMAKDISNELVVLILAVLFGSYCIVGGLGTTFYISYFTTALTFTSVLVFIVNVSYIDNAKVPSLEEMYEAMTCLDGPDGNLEDSFMTFVSKSGILYGIVMFLMTTALNFMDQGNWQSRIAAKPSQGVSGFLVASFLWFAIPTSISLTSTATYLTMCYENGTQLLSDDDIEAGSITPFVMKYTMGASGGYLLLLMTTMALMSTGSGEVMAIASIIVYDIYRIYINPFRSNLKITDCPLCGRHKHDTDKESKGCKCPSAINCKACIRDATSKSDIKSVIKFYTECSLHGPYRQYQDLLLHYKSWCMVWITMAIIPYGILILYSEINLTWGMFFLQTLLSAFITPLLFSFTWVKCTEIGMIVGSIAGLIASFSTILIVGETAYEEGLGDFLTSTSSDFSLIGGIISGVGTSTIFTVGISLCTHKIQTKDDANVVWKKTLSIDNPLTPWRELYKEELSRYKDNITITTKHMKHIFRNTRYLALAGGALSIVVFIVVIPSVTLGFGVLNFSQFSTWLNVCQIWVMVGAVFAILVPPIQEIYLISRQYSDNKQRNKRSDEGCNVPIPNNQTNETNKV